MRNILRWARARAQEPTTWAGLAIIATQMGVSAETANHIAQGFALILGGALVVTTDGAR